MILEILLAFLLGILAGIVTGLAPGIHSNLITSLLVSIAPTFSFITPLPAVTFIVSLAMTHTSVEFIPTVFLNAPEEDAFLALLPSQQMLADGRGYEAIALLVFGSLLGLALALLITPLYLIALPHFYPFLTSTIPYLLIALSVYLICRESRPLLAAFIFLLAALLGLLTFRLPVKEPLLPLLTGLFGLSSMFISLAQVRIPKQNAKTSLKKIAPSKKEWGKSLAASLIAAPLCSSLPGIGAGHAATLGSEAIPQNNRSFLLLVGSLATAVMALSFVTVYAIARARSGAALALQEFFQPFTQPELLFTLAVMFSSSLLAAVLTLFLARRASSLLNAINYRLLSYLVISFLILFTLFISNFLGLLVLLTASTLGLFCVRSGARRINLMASLIVPAIVFYLTH